MTSTLPLLNGIEVEALMVQRTRRYDEAPQEGGALDFLGRHFQEADLEIAVEPSTGKMKYDTWQLTWDGSIHHADILNPTETQAERGESAGVELVSPPMPAFEPTARPQNQECFETIRRYMDVLAGDKSSRGEYSSVSSIDVSCGLHVHFGLPDNQPIPLGVLKCLALLLVVYEPTINSLHHWQRTPYEGTKASFYARSNLIGLQKDKHACHGLVSWQEIKQRIFGASTPPILAALMGSETPKDNRYKAIEDWEQIVCETYLPGDEPPALSEGNPWFNPWSDGPVEPFFPAKIESSTVKSGLEGSKNWSSIVSSEADKAYWSEQMSGESFTTAESWNHEEEAEQEICSDNVHSSWAEYNPVEAELGGDKYKIVRWQLLDRWAGDGPRTIEFRQAAGTLDPEEIAYTMQFNAALINAAARMAEADTQCLPNETADGVRDPSLQSLLEMLQLHDDANRYWLDRAEQERLRRVKDGREDKDLLSRQKCPQCSIDWRDNDGFMAQRQGFRRAEAECDWSEWTNLMGEQVWAMQPSQPVGKWATELEEQCAGHENVIW
jgi:hypothetical protein